MIKGESDWKMIRDLRSEAKLRSDAPLRLEVTRSTIDLEVQHLWAEN